MILQQDERDVYTLNVPSGAKALKLTLVWDDYPGDPLAGQSLVNDLDLVVTGPDGKQYYPWTLDPSSPEKQAERMRADHTNNVEQVSVENPAEGPMAGHGLGHDCASAASDVFIDLRLDRTGRSGNGQSDPQHHRQPGPDGGGV